MILTGPIPSSKSRKRLPPVEPAVASSPTEIAASTPSRPVLDSGSRSNRLVEGQSQPDTVNNGSVRGCPSSGKRKREAVDSTSNFPPTFVASPSQSPRVVAPSDSPAQQAIASIRSRNTATISSQKKQKSDPSIQPFLNSSKRSPVSSVVSTLHKLDSSPRTKPSRLDHLRIPSPSGSLTSSHSTPMLKTESTSSSSSSSRHTTPASSAPSLISIQGIHSASAVSRTASVEPPGPPKRPRIDSSDSPSTMFPAETRSDEIKGSPTSIDTEEEVMSLKMKRKELREGKDLLRDLNKRWGELDSEWEKLN
ncbi:hypothetical protein JCM5350_003439 [Sporobolomyces pararoseus]